MVKSKCFPKKKPTKEPCHKDLQIIGVTMADNDDHGLRCPACNSAWSEVVNTIKGVNFIRRYRQCMNRHCGKRWPTTELSHAPKKEKPQIKPIDDIFIIED